MKDIFNFQSALFLYHQGERKSREESLDTKKLPTRATFRNGSWFQRWGAFVKID